MNYYRRYSGDYLRDTARLNLTEHGAYGLMLDYIYSDEQPLPADHNEIYLLLRAMRPEDRKAVDKVLSIFFYLADDGYHQKRADKEIATSKQARCNGKMGGRPQTGTGTGTGTGLETEDETGIVTGIVTEQWGGLGHPPTTNHQPPTTNQKIGVESSVVKNNAVGAEPENASGSPPSVAPLPPAKVSGHKPDSPQEIRSPDDETAVVSVLLTNTGDKFLVTDRMVDDWERLFPGVDVVQALNRAEAWLEANPKRRKTARGMKSFLVAWLSREQDRPRKSV